MWEIRDVKPGWRTFLIVAVCAAVAIATALFVWPRGEREPEYQGKKLSEWIERPYGAPEGAKQRAERIEAIRHIGTNALPFLVERIKAVGAVTETTKLDTAVGRASKKAEYELKKFRNRPKVIADNDAVAAFLALGELGSPAIPELVQLAGSTNKIVSASAIRALLSIGKSAKPALSNLAESSDAGLGGWVRETARRALEIIEQRESRTNQAGKSQ